MSTGAQRPKVWAQEGVKDQLVARVLTGTICTHFKRLTITDLAAPLGPGRHYNLVECPIQNWPPECEYESSDECREAMEAT